MFRLVKATPRFPRKISLAKFSTLPKAVGKSVWYGNELQNRPERWTYDLTAENIRELRDAVAGLEAKKLDIQHITKENFSLPVLGKQLAKIQDDLINGIGFVLVRSLPLKDLTRWQTVAAFFGIGAHFGRAVSQNAQGHIVGHVKDIGGDPTKPDTRLYTTNERQRYHCDSCDIVGLLCLQRAMKGGLSSLASSPAVYNEMRKNHPDLVRELLTPMWWDRKGEIPAGKLPYYQGAIMNWHEGLLSTRYDRTFIIAAQRFPDVPRLTDKQIEALDTMEALAEKHHLDMDFQPGDMQFAHNHSVLHARTAYQDWPEASQRRHLLRLWLSADNGRALPPNYVERYGNIAQGSLRGGIIVPGSKFQAPLDV